MNKTYGLATRTKNTKQLQPNNNPLIKNKRNLCSPILHEWDFDTSAKKHMSEIAKGISSQELFDKYCKRNIELKTRYEEKGLSYDEFSY